MICESAKITIRISVTGNRCFIIQQGFPYLFIVLPKLTDVMKKVHTITVSVFAKPDENKDELKLALIDLFPFSLEEEKIIIQESSSSTFDNRKMYMYEVTIEKERHTNAFIDMLLQNFSDVQKEEVRTQENRLDNELRFYIRLEKESLVNKQFTLTDEGNCFHIKMSVAAFPKKKEVALKIIKEVFS